MDKTTDAYPKHSPFVDDYNREAGCNAADFNEDGTKVVIDRKHFVRMEYRRAEERANVPLKVIGGIFVGLIIGLCCGRK
jgi:hypothetical protein